MEIGHVCLDGFERNLCPDEVAAFDLDTVKMLMSIFVSISW
jgi:hypothetical protein